MSVEDDAESSAWHPGGIFGKVAEDWAEADAEAYSGPFPDGKGGFRDHPGYGNVLGAQETIMRRRRIAAERDGMLVWERFVVELPELRKKLLDSFGPNGLRGKLLDKLIPQQTFMTRPDTVHEALGARITEALISTTAEIFSRAYARDIRRAEAAVRLGAFEPEEWAAAQTQKILTAPAATARAVLNRARTLVARVKHVSNAMTEALPEPIVEETLTEPNLDDEDGVM